MASSTLNKKPLTYRAYLVEHHSIPCTNEEPGDPHIGYGDLLVRGGRRGEVFQSYCFPCALQLAESVGKGHELYNSLHKAMSDGMKNRRFNGRRVKVLGDMAEARSKSAQLVAHRLSTPERMKLQDKIQARTRQGWGNG